MELNAMCNFCTMHLASKNAPNQRPSQGKLSEARTEV